LSKMPRNRARAPRTLQQILGKYYESAQLGITS
jgi:hypothetical protein